VHANSTAQKVCVAGDFNHWSPDTNPLSRTASGLWELQMQLPTGRHEYLFTVDGRWVPDPKAVISAPNQYGGRNSVMLV
jgi:1,4-alpha-glucan branching enzyme